MRARPSPPSGRRPEIASDRASRADRGAAAAELAILVPLVVLLMAVAVFGGRLFLTRSAVTDAAAAGARAASLARTAPQATAAAQQAVSGNLAQDQVPCDALTTVPDVSGFAVPVGQPATVAVEIGCTVRLSDVAFPGLPGSIRLTTRSTSVLDTYRGRR